MGIPVLVYGRSGSGKSRSLLNFGEDEILLINVQRKPLPFRKKFRYVYSPQTDGKGRTRRTVLITAASRSSSCTSTS